MAHGLPVVAFRAGAIPELVGTRGAGVLVPALDLDGMAREIHNLLDDTSAYRNASEAALNEALRFCDLTRLALEYAATIDQGLRATSNALVATAVPASYESLLS